ncbi:MAG: Glutamate-tRNA ligase [Candidatus Uhrbacteria bacterium GW2011_GWE2_40_58]|nr:MAG: Glutamate-tRNA ligase [Candidatus Uhrbacteria bacterium GW2011_GWF2_40_263]KKR67796.1 MAG: Glutamate-tRNA ligase [Candidatus Uhrbacteria bacterium GW2011_GWE2_40_58]OGL94503.1 MAG: glutamate--tRNA ligase [Candidatus Uhrbacteria bacterium RIFOXYA2_FULL_40_9]OGL96753.1 MAG: glutamate--tRNA ligase [Candidatus Uhrbacteria bacterium RIFOXYB2_FULL_41_18]HBK34469.1 glutamate--tRNA ligase [Candidatus Uhrbacteria bacterium]
MTVRTRLAPSPTGYLHIGNLRTALYNYLLARKFHGQFILRIEDTDQARFVDGAIESLLKTFTTIGLDHDEGPYLEEGNIVQKGDYGPYIQSERLELYRKYADQLVRDGKAYYCFCSKERIEEVRKQQEIAKLQPKYDRHCLTLSTQEVQAKLDGGEPFVIRMKIPEGETVFTDAIRGSISINHAEIDDQVIMKSDGFPTYHLAVVVDDHLMNISHIIRGEEWLSSVPKHILLYNYFGWEIPIFAHLPLILNQDRSKLSKRQGDVAVEDYLAKGYLPEALINFIALLGFNPKGDQEIYPLQELIDSFELSKVNKSGAVFDHQKLDWMNGQYIKQLTNEELVIRCKTFLEKAEMEIDTVLFEKICFVEKDRLTRLDEIVDHCHFYLTPSKYETDLLIWKKADKQDALSQLQQISLFIEELKENIFDSLELIESSIKRYIEERDFQNGNVLWPLRVALSGKSSSPSPFELMWIFGKKHSLDRIQEAIIKLTL